MRLRLAAALAVPLLLAAGCSSSSSSTSATPSPTSTTGTETITAQDTGSSAASNLNNGSSTAPLTFPAGATLAGPVPATIKPFSLGGPQGHTGTVTWKTSAGPLTVYHADTGRFATAPENQPPPATWTKTGGKCYFVTTFDEGKFHQVGAFATSKQWAGTFRITAAGYAPLKGGSTTCGFNTTGAVENDGARITFMVTGPMVAKTS